MHITKSWYLSKALYAWAGGRERESQRRVMGKEMRRKEISGERKALRSFSLRM